MKDKEVIISDPGDEVEPIIVKAELIYIATMIIFMIIFLIFGAMYHPRSKYKNSIEKYDRENYTINRGI